jgi:hypothetical protein
MQNTERIWSLVEAQREPFQELSDRRHAGDCLR